MFHNHTILDATYVRRVVTGAAYAGAFERYGAAISYRGLRAYSAATRGTAAIQVSHSTDSDVARHDVITNASTGLLNLGDSFLDGSTISIWKVYDQTGNGHDFTSATAGNYTLVVDSGVPSMLCNAGYLTGTGAITQAQPITFSTVARPVGIEMLSYADATTNTQCGFNTGGTAAVAHCAATGTPITASCTDNAWHAVQYLLNGAGSAIQVDGTLTSPLTALTIGLSDYSYAGNAAGFKFREIGAWGGDKSASFGGMNTDQHTAWAF